MNKLERIQNGLVGVDFVSLRDKKKVKESSTHVEAVFDVNVDVVLVVVLRVLIKFVFRFALKVVL